MEINTLLLDWFSKNKRNLPWRLTGDPYAIWISEIMLQQTTVAAVRPFYERFINTFPTVESLANAKEEKVLSLWSGLGYYSRARNLQKAAKAIVENKYFPKTYAALIELPGIGPYTAAAVASIAYGEEVAAIDGNVIRVISRLFDIKEDVNSKAGKSFLTQYAQGLIKGQPPSEHNQAMMELGATICTPKNPSCLMCPVRKLCKAHRADTVLLRPIKKKNRKQEPWLWKMLYIENKEGKIALVKEQNGTPWLNHLWILPGYAAPWTKKTDPVTHFRHSITHHKIYVQLKSGKKTDILKNKNIKWLKPHEIKTHGVSSIVLKALKYREQR